MQAIDQPLDLSVPENLMILSVYLALPDIDNKRRSIKITEGVRAAVNSGRWLGKAPYGYKNARDEKNKPIIIPSEKAEVVKKIFAELSRDKSQAEVREFIKKKGFNIPRATFSVIVRNRVYVGDLHVNNEKGGYFVKGLHEPLIDGRVFEKEQSLLQANYKVLQLAKPKAFKEELPLRGLLLCECCGKQLTGSASRSKGGRRYYYYHCNHCGGQRIRAASTHNKVEQILSEFKVTKEARNLYEAMVKKLLGKQKAPARSVLKVHEEIAHLERCLEILDDNFLDKTIDLNAYTKAKYRYNVALEKLKAELEPKDSSLSKFQKLARTGIHLLENLPRLIKTAMCMRKEISCVRIFPEKLTISKKKSNTNHK